MRLARCFGVAVVWMGATASRRTCSTAVAHRKLGTDRWVHHRAVNREQRGGAWTGPVDATGERCWRPTRLTVRGVRTPSTPGASQISVQGGEVELTDPPSLPRRRPSVQRRRGCFWPKFRRYGLGGPVSRNASKPRRRCRRGCARSNEERCA